MQSGFGALLGIAFLLGTLPVIAQSAAGPEAAGLDVSLPAAKRLAGARDLIALAQWDAAIESLQQIEDEFGDRLVEVEPGRLLNIRDACSAVLSLLPAEGLQRLRQRSDPTVKSVYEEALRLHDADLMRQVVRNGFAGSYGDDALNWLAEDAWLQGDLDSARAYWTQLIPRAESSGDLPLLARYPDTGLQLADIRARLVLCSIMQRHDTRVAAELDAFRQLHPDAAGHLCGRDGVLEGILADEWERSRTWAPHDDSGWATFSADVRRSGRVATRPDVGVPRWTFSLPSTRLPLVSLQRPALPDYGGAACYPVVWRDTVLVNDARTVWAVDVQSGLPKWPSGDDDDRGILYSDPLPGDLLTLPTVGVPRFSATVADGFYFARMGQPIVVPASGAVQFPESRLICLDLERAEGRVVWAAGPDDVLSTPGWMFSGAPLALRERLYVAIRRSAPQVDSGIACLSALSGDLIWECRVAGALQQPPSLHHVVDHELLTAAEGLVFCVPGSGVVAALEQEGGAMRWVVTYPSVAAEPDVFSDAASRRLTPPLYHAGRLYVAPPDRDHIMALDAGSGAEIWTMTAPGRITHLLGVAEQTLIAQGDRLWAIDVETGNLRHRPLGFDDPAGYGFGRGVIAGTSVFWTTRDELFAVDIDSWTIIRRIPLQDQYDWTGGNLVVTRDMVLIAQPEQLSALGPRIE
jgi:outer membrane protein assembly factor BamB